jgi:hypothetical protein
VKSVVVEFRQQKDSRVPEVPVVCLFVCLFVCFYLFVCLGWDGMGWDGMRGREVGEEATEEDNGGE